MRTLFYTALIDRLKEFRHRDNTPVFSHYDLWNRQVEFLDDETPFALPAVFIQFQHIEWGAPMQGIKRATIPFTLHVVTEYRGSEKNGSPYQAAALERLSIVDALGDHLNNWRLDGEEFIVQQTHHTGSDTNHDHDDLIEDIEHYTCTAIKKIIQPKKRVTPLFFKNSAIAVSAAPVSGPKYSR